MNKFENQFFQNLDNINQCPECNGKIIKHEFQYICSSCGLIVEEEMNPSSYKISNNSIFKFNQNLQYVYIGKTIETIGNLGSYIDFYEKTSNFKDYRGKILSPKKQKLFLKLKNKYSKFLKIKNYETDYRILRILSDVIQLLNLNNSVKKDAAYLFRKIKNANRKIKNNITLIAFCILYAIRHQCHNAPITIKEIVEVFKMLGHRINPRLIIRNGITYKKILQPPRPHKSEDYISRLVSNIISYPDLEKRIKKKNPQLDLKNYGIKLFNETILLLKNIDLKKRGGRNPFIFAGAAIYCADKILATKLNAKSILTQKIAANAMNIAEYSIRDHYISIFKNLSFNLK